MIRALRGELTQVSAEGVILRTSAGVAYEIQMGGYALAELRALMDAGEPAALHTYHYLEGNVATSPLLPRLAGFLTDEEREFFLCFIKVPGISPRSAVRAMSLSPRQIAGAISAGDAALLTGLPGIGKKKAEQIIARLKEEIAELSLAAQAAQDGETPAAAAAPHGDVMAVLVGQLGYRTPEAESLIERALDAVGADAETEAILEEVFRLSHQAS